MKIAVMGAGAMGSWIGALLSNAGHDVTLIGRDPHMGVVAGKGLEVSGRTTLDVHLKAVTRPSMADVPDVLILAVKAHQTRQALADAHPILGARTLVVSMQNGLGNVEAIADLVDDRRVFAAVTTHGVTFVEPGHVRHAGTGYFVVGSPFNEHDAARRLADLFASAGLDVAFTDRIVGELWAKVVVNCAINPITAITGLKNGALLDTPPLRELMQRVVEEAVDVARAENAPLPEGEDLLARARRVAELTASNKSSMLQDIERARQTEIDAICGEIVQRGLRHGIDTPVNLSLRALVKGIEESTRR